MHERVDMSREIRQCLRSGALSRLPESDQQGHPNEDVAGGVVLFGEPSNVAFNSVTDPGRTNPVDGCRAEEVTVKHENLLSVEEVQEIIVRL
jgi:hypothetical protein